MKEIHQILSLLRSIVRIHLVSHLPKYCDKAQHCNNSNVCIFNKLPLCPIKLSLPQLWMVFFSEIRITSAMYKIFNLRH